VLKDRTPRSKCGRLLRKIQTPGMLIFCSDWIGPGLDPAGMDWIETPASGGFFEEVQGSGQRAFRWFWDYGLIF
jgi:hypothetical protein